MRSPGHGASFGPCVVHLSPQRRTVGGDLADGDDLLPVQRYEGVEFLHSLKENKPSRDQEGHDITVCDFKCNKYNKHTLNAAHRDAFYPLCANAAAPARKKVGFTRMNLSFGAELNSS